MVASDASAGKVETSTSSAGFDVLGDEDFGRLDGSVGFGAGACALSASVTASAAARSAAREAACGVGGASGDGLGAFVQLLDDGGDVDLGGSND